MQIIQSAKNLLKDNCGVSLFETDVLLEPFGQLLVEHFHDNVEAHAVLDDFEDSHYAWMIYLLHDF